MIKATQVSWKITVKLIPPTALKMLVTKSIFSPKVYLNQIYKNIGCVPQAIIYDTWEVSAVFQ